MKPSHRPPDTRGKQTGLNLERRSTCRNRVVADRLRQLKARGASLSIASQPTLRQAWPRECPGAAICVQDVDVR